MNEVTYKNTFFHSLRQSLVMALILLLLCGFVFPVLLTDSRRSSFPARPAAVWSMLTARQRDPPMWARSLPSPIL